MNLIRPNTIQKYVAKDFITAAVFTKYEINFCCKGQRFIEEVCTKNEVSENQLLEELHPVLELQNDVEINFNSWSLDVLIVYIDKKHNPMLKKKLPF